MKISIDLIHLVENVVQNYIKLLNEQVANILMTISSADKISYGLWNNAAIILGYLSYHPSSTPSEIIEAVIEITFMDENIAMAIDICRPEGEIITTIRNLVLPFKTEEDTLQNIDNLLRTSLPEILSRMERLIYAYNNLDF